MKELEHLKAQLNAVTKLRAWIAGEIEELEAETVEKWEPIGGDWLVSGIGIANIMQSTPISRAWGVERATKDKTEAASRRMRTFNRLDAWIDENVAEWCQLWVEFNGNTVAITRSLPIEKINELKRLLDTGEVKL